MNQPRAVARFNYWHELVLFGLLIGLLALAEYLSPGFLSLRGQLYLSRHLWVFAIMALSMTLILIAGGIDLSVGSAMGLCAVAFGVTFEMTGQLHVAIIACLLTGVLGGLFNGALIARFNLHPLIVTLATYAAFRGMAEGISQGESYSQFGDRFSELSRATLLGIPLPGYLFFVLAVLVGLFLWRTPTGRSIYAIGHSAEAARFSGISVNRIRIRLYTFSGFLAGLATVIYVSRFDTAKADAGRGFELDVITAVVVGGTSIFGGRGTIVGTVLGLLLIHETRQFVGRYWQVDELKSIVVGVLLIVSVLIYQLLVTQRETRSH